MKPKYVRTYVGLPTDLAERLDALTAKRGASKSNIIVDAVRAWLNRYGLGVLETKFAIRLDRMSRQCGRIERDHRFLIECMALYIQYQLTISPPVPEDDGTGWAVGLERWSAFVTHVERQIELGRHSLDRTRDLGPMP